MLLSSLMQYLGYRKRFVTECKLCGKDIKKKVVGLQNFFLISLSHDSLLNYYSTNFQLMQHHKYSLTELDEMMPWEREIYIQLLLNHLEEERGERERNNARTVN